jgi:hypothetical protein
VPSWWTELGPAGPILGAVITATVASLVTYKFTVARKTVVFTTFVERDLTRLLKTQHLQYKLTIEDIPIDQLMAQEVVVVHKGNRAVTHFEFFLTLHGEAKLFSVAPLRTERNLADDIEIKENLINHSASRSCSVSMPFFNPGERFIVRILHNGDAEGARIDCRLPEVKVLINSVSIPIYPFKPDRRLHVYRVTGLPWIVRKLLEWFIKALP